MAKGVAMKTPLQHNLLCEIVKVNRSISKPFVCVRGDSLYSPILPGRTGFGSLSGMSLTISGVSFLGDQSSLPTGRGL